MAIIYSYQKHIDATRTVEMRLPGFEDGERMGVELATVGGVTYISLPEDAALPEQPAEIASTVTEVTVDALLREQIKAASPHCKLIAQRRIAKIRDGYSPDDELYLARIGTGTALGMHEPSDEELNELTVYKEFVEAIREWAREEYRALGL